MNAFEMSNISPEVAKALLLFEKALEEDYSKRGFDDTFGRAWHRKKEDHYRLEARRALEQREMMREELDKALLEAKQGIGNGGMLLFSAISWALIVGSLAMFDHTPTQREANLVTGSIGAMMTIFIGMTWLWRFLVARKPPVSTGINRLLERMATAGLEPSDCSDTENSNRFEVGELGGITGMGLAVPPSFDVALSYLGTGIRTVTVHRDDTGRFWTGRLPDHGAGGASITVGLDFPRSSEWYEVAPNTVEQSR